MGNSIAVGFFNSWVWAIFVIVGLLFVLLELIVGVETGFDLVIIGSILIIAGLATMPFHSWWITTISASIICAGYVGIGRKYIHRRRWKDEIKTNIDAIIGQSGIVLRRITKYTDGQVKVRNEKWKAQEGALSVEHREPCILYKTHEGQCFTSFG